MQGTIEQAVERLTGKFSPVTGAGRTDAGAHALAQVIAFSTSSELPADTFRRGLNAHLPADIRVISARETDADFHPQYHAASRRYRYLIWNRNTASPFWLGRAAFVHQPLDECRMHEAAQTLVGRHDFTTFVSSTAIGSRVRTMIAARVGRDGYLITVELEANGFMQAMVRSIVGTLILCGRGILEPSDVAAMLIREDRSLAGDTAPAHGLYLVDVRYPAAPPAAATQQNFEETE